MREIALTAIGGDRPGIVAAVTEVLLDLGCNLADCSMSLLRDQFAMILLIQAPEGVSLDDVLSALREPADRLALLTMVREVSHAKTPPPSKPYVVSLYGADRPGIVHTVTRAFADKAVNITDFVSHLVDGSYTMMLDIDVPIEIDQDSLSAELQAIAKELGVDVTIRSAEVEEL